MPLGVPAYKFKVGNKLPSPLPTTIPAPTAPAVRPGLGTTPRTLRDFSDQLISLEDTAKIRKSSDAIVESLTERMTDSTVFLAEKSDLADVDDEPKKRRVRAKWSRI